VNHDNRFQRSERTLRFASPRALAALALLLAIAGCVRDEQPTTLTGDSTGTQTPQPPGSSPGTPAPGTPPTDGTPTPVDPSTPTTTPPTTDIAAFQQTLYPHLRDRRSRWPT